ncbi:uncharacterized protein [Temnothorax longispinosus]|uniref:uncharacterized protein n=1 Tax=Temnothorax longispinosus TaxID=300112 RepID=UPI003A9A19D1
MENAPVLFSSNMTEKEIKDKRELAFNIISTDENVHVLHNISKDDFSDENNIRINLQDEDEFSFKTISGNTNEDKLDNANKEHVVNDEKDIKIIDSQVLEFLIIIPPSLI